MRARALLLLALSGCGLGKPYPRTEICADAASAVSARVETCTGSLATGRAAERDFSAEVTCDPTQTERPSGELYECLGAIDALTCDQVLAHSDDWYEWLRVSPVCDEFLWVDGAGDDTGR